MDSVSDNDKKYWFPYEQSPPYFFHAKASTTVPRTRPFPETRGQVKFRLTKEREKRLSSVAAAAEAETRYGKVRKYRMTTIKTDHIQTNQFSQPPLQD